MTGLIWWLMACGGEDPGKTQEQVQDSATSEPTPYIYEELDDEEFTYDQAAVEDALNAAFAEAMQLNAGPVLDAYAIAMEGATEDCPDYYSDGTNVYWYDYCTSSEGASFSGYSFFYAYDNTSDGYYTWTGDTMYTEAVIETPDGYDFEGGGYAYLLDGVDPSGALIYYSVLGGAFSWDGDGIDGTWMADGVRAELSMWITQYPEYETNYVYVTGGVTNLGSEFDTVSFTDLTYGSKGSWWSCEGEPAGTASVRAADGSWFDVIFDVDPDTWEVDDALCDGCGTVWHRGEIVGEACPDPNPLTDWEGSPW